MADFRWDPVNGQWVIIAENRAQRPNEYLRAQGPTPATPTDKCPFCFGNEANTPKEIAVYEATQPGGRWLTRVFSNKYPAVHQTLEQCETSKVGPYLRGDFTGYHEVIVESPDHKTSLAELTDEETDAAFKAYRDRIDMFSRHPRVNHAMLFKNCRPEAGASIEHLHSQILCTSITTEKVLRRVNRAQQFHLENDIDVISSIVDFEREASERIIDETDQFVAFCPFASRFGYLMSIAPKSRCEKFYELSDQQASELGRFIRQTVIRLESCLPEVAYNMLLHIAPFDISADEYYQWHIELFPRLSNPAGYEWGTGCWINPVAPEVAANALRNASVVMG